MSTQVSTEAPFSLGLGEGLDSLLGLGTLQRLYETLPPGDFVDRALERLDVQVGAEGLDVLPEHGPAIVVANHPTGALDGLALIAAIRRRRPDIRVLGNRWLTRIPEMREWTIPIDTRRRSTPANVYGLRAAERWIDGGGAVAVFPAGAVARRTTGSGGEDEPWHPGVLSLARWTGAPVVPAFLTGRPSRWFRLLGRVHPMAGTLLLPRELLRQRGARVLVRFGTAAGVERLSDLPDSSARLAYLRARVQGLSPSSVAERPAAPLAPTVIPSLVRREVAALPAECRLSMNRNLAVFGARADQIPHTLREIGRLRETTFRAVGEGTGGAIDLDRYDREYLHLFLWDIARAEVAGAYRMGATDQDPQGGLYTESLFSWRPRPGDLLGPALELGRSFIRAEHQRNPGALLLLWKAIGSFVARHSRYRRLFGPVSISATYHPVSRDLIAAWLERHAWSRAAGEVRARHAVEVGTDARALVDAIPTVAALDQAVRELENGRGLPVLLRQYLRLNGRVLALGRDPAFGNVLDALIVVDMLEMPATHLERYCGSEGAKRIRAERGLNHPAA